MTPCADPCNGAQMHERSRTEAPDVATEVPAEELPEQMHFDDEGNHTSSRGRARMLSVSVWELRRMLVGMPVPYKSAVHYNHTSTTSKVRQLATSG
jgi:hypothetical protein